MQLVDRVILRIRRRDSPLAERLYRVAKRLRAFHMPVIPGIHRLLYDERRLRLALWHRVVRVIYHEPLFKTQCIKIGKNLRLVGGMPLLMGNQIRLFIGDDVTISGVTTFVGSKMANAPRVVIGNGSSIGDQTTIITGHGVHIGDHVMIANKVLIAGDDGAHPETMTRVGNRTPKIQDAMEVSIEDGAWIGEGAIVLKAVHVGKGSVVAAHAVVTHDVPAFTVVAGNPARVVRMLQKPEEAATWHGVSR